MVNRFRMCFVACVMVAASVGVSLPVEAQAASWDTAVAASSPSHWWNLDSTAAGATAADSAGSLTATHGPDAAATVGVDDSAGVVGPAGSEGLSLDGSATQFDQVSVELWFKPDPATAVTNDQRLIRHRTHGYHVDWSPDLGAVTAGVTLADANGDEWDNVDLVAVGVDPAVWHHVVLVVDTAKVSLWVDGNERDTFEFSPSNATGVLYTGDLLTVGTDSIGPGDSRQFSGAIDEVVLYDRALAGAEIETHFTSTGRVIEPFVATLNGSAYAAAVVNSGPVAYWQMDDPAGSTVVDDSIDPNANTAAVTSAPTFGVPGIFDDSTAVSFDNRSETVALPAGVLSGLEDAFTFELWFNTAQASGVGRMLRAYTHGVGIDWAGGTQLLHAWLTTPGGQVSLVSDRPLGLNEWHHVAVVFDGSEFRMVINGELHDVAAAPAATATFNTSGSLTLGNDRPGTKKRNLIGTVDEVAIYDTALDTTEIAGHYTASGRMAPVGLAVGEAITECVGLGGNVYLAEPTVAEINGVTETYTAGCYFYDECDATWNGWAGDTQAWVCDHQTELVVSFAASAFVIPAVICLSSGACIPVALSGQAGATTAETAATIGLGGLIVIGELAQIAEDGTTIQTPVYGEVGVDEAPHPALIEYGVESPAPIFIEPEFFDENGDWLDDPEESTQYCPPDSKRPFMLIPPLGEEQWKHIGDRHLHQWSDTPNNAGFPDQFREAIDIEDYPFDWNLSDEQNTKRNLMMMIYATICYGEVEPNSGFHDGSLYTGHFPTNIGDGRLQPNPTIDSPIVETHRMQVLVKDDLWIWTAYPQNPGNW